MNSRGLSAARLRRPRGTAKPSSSRASRASASPRWSGRPARPRRTVAARCSGAPATSWGRRCRYCPSWTACGSVSLRPTRGRKRSSRCCAARSRPAAARTCPPRWPSSCSRWSASCAPTLPTVLVVDDLQWADQASVTLWERLSRSARHLPLLLVGMMRPVPQREDLLALRHTADLAARLQLDGLPEESVTELVETLAGGKPDEELLRARRRRRRQPALPHRTGGRAGPQLQPDGLRAGPRS